MSSNDFLAMALKKLTEEEKKVTGQKESVIKREVRAALEEFCRQDAELAQAVVQGGSFSDCLKKVCEGVGSCISDLKAYQKAAAFYFPGCDVTMTMRIALCESDAKVVPAAEPVKAVTLDLMYHIPSDESITECEITKDLVEEKLSIEEQKLKTIEEK